MIRHTYTAPLLLTAILALMLSACHSGNSTPKPEAYIRIDLPPHSYHLCDTSSLPFTFDISDTARLEMKKESRRETWADVEYAAWKGVVFLSYKSISSADDLRGQTDTSLRLLENHYQFSSGVEEKAYSDPENNIYGTLYLIHGSRVASTCQFWLTDSSRHFLRGALYLDRTTNNDSLAPVLNFMKEDIERMVESVRWRKP